MSIWDDAEAISALIAERDRALSELAEARKALLILMRQADLSTVRDSNSQAIVMAALFLARQAEAARAAIPADDLASSEVERDADSPVSGAGRCVKSKPHRI